MAKIYNTDNPEDFRKENEISLEIEEAIHKGILTWIKEQLSTNTLNEALLDNFIPDFEFPTVEGLDELSDYGTIEVSYFDKSSKSTQVLAHFIRQKRDDEEEEILEEEEVIEEEEPIPDMEEGDEDIDIPEDDEEMVEKDQDEEEFV